MKIFVLVLFLSLMMCLGECRAESTEAVAEPTTLVVSSDTAATTQMQSTPKKAGFLAKFATKAFAWGGSALLGFIALLLAKKGWLQRIKFWASKCTIIFTETGEFFLACGRATDTIDKCILDNNKLKENSLKEMLAAKKEVVAEFEDMVVIFKHKPKA